MQDKLIVMDIDRPKASSFEYRFLEIADFAGNNGDGLFNLVGMTGVQRDDHVDLYLVNNRPSFDVTTGGLLEHAEVGGNSTIELFSAHLSDGEAKHIKTFANSQIATPNNIAPTGDGSFYFTNDHGLSKVGVGHHLSPFRKTGDISYCDARSCRPVGTGHSFPNGLALALDGLLYVPSSFSGNIKVYSTSSDGAIVQVDTIKLPYPLDNLSVDANGDIWVPGLPRVQETLASFDNPLGPTPAATIFRIHKTSAGKYVVDKILEDSKGEVLPGATAVIHDVGTGRLFVSGVVSPFITVCEPSKAGAS